MAWRCSRRICGQIADVMFEELEVEHLEVVATTEEQGGKSLEGARGPCSKVYRSCKYKKDFLRGLATSCDLIVLKSRKDWLQGMCELEYLSVGPRHLGPLTQAFLPVSSSGQFRIRGSSSLAGL